ncbi:hypothetical protein [Arthrobacter sp. Leaf69]|uniref:hypothetical protein n=1 Tax=Arthrobacter sp. Leaf69 TaxID=1736232 RepID=UPI0006FD85C4|nr:hypothetical protein [Arthrobacter sp. Leaf69]KQN86527.1 hypothetical protein ASE96_13240 [Arthrobacter sp. Leaf69]
MKKLAIPGAALLSITILTGCSGAAVSADPATPTTASSTAVATVTQTVTITPKPTPSTVPTTGSYKADLAALGVVPDNVESFADFMKQQVCEKTGTSLGVSVRSVGGNSTGGGVSGVRLTVAYFCPNKSQEVESFLNYFKK